MVARKPAQSLGIARLPLGIVLGGLRRSAAPDQLLVLFVVRSGSGPTSVRHHPGDGADDHHRDGQHAGHHVARVVKAEVVARQARR
eukprot:NODE_4179_length_601_cov_305.331522_g3013_i0.p4 GENE.NODE_4179_length_601_cov_305.331522_g3013_i0~~NODE_4179_length_601_cov_305.331522_g3013_i0.p4  ORF type:complete len:86 (-),score=25.47 NODE_4179_length_601_cov_305.331522_g3013_i0:92-349(-)